jgi:hypothetical protein
VRYGNFGTQFVSSPNQTFLLLSLPKIVCRLLELNLLVFASFYTQLRFSLTTVMFVINP